VEIFEILDGRLYQSGAPQEAAEWDSIHARGIDVVPDALGNAVFTAYLRSLPAPPGPPPSSEASTP
jgi:hypothetical protein